MVVRGSNDCGGVPMTTSADGVEVVDVPTEGRFVLRRNGAEAELAYRLQGDRLILVHTEVPDTLSGQGIGGQLVQAALRRADADHLTLVPWCPFAHRWLHDHPDAVAGLTIDWESPPPWSA
jgi:uncharacterized protein